MIQKSTSLKYEPSSELLFVTAKQLFLNRARMSVQLPRRLRVVLQNLRGSVTSGAVSYNHPEKPIFLLSYGNELYYTNSLIILVRRICVVKITTVTQKKNIFSRIHKAALGLFLNVGVKVASRMCTVIGHVTHALSVGNVTNFLATLYTTDFLKTRCSLVWS